MTHERIAITGGPSGGKSTAINYLGRLNPQCVLVPEVATILLSGGFPAPSEERPWTYDWQQSFQRAVGGTQLAIEEVADSRAAAEDLPRIVCDRGLADGSAYLQGGIDELGEMIGMEPAAILGRYSIVIHLVTSAKQTRGYQKYTNKHRFEDAEVAKQLDDRVLEAWSGHPNRIISDTEDADERNSLVWRAAHGYRIER